ncbi:hypothetical protein SmJEL517_g02184 [Synchytrium microbalum]|uniref:SOUL heme-binding protein n=1 Tax=Synchytrium microbalum TaxID=1806994 RepID=A0A507C2U4_9FUNG|nr:uncharacterized protein SmJEL517_g02184 [Synchytrium microbalum]TPX35447.1 hypothetical protein SmJEL517_g02184 [Synchytrium microbalum]
MHVEQPVYQVIYHTPEYELRKYGPQVRATFYQDDQHSEKSQFMVVARYIFGSNKGSNGEKEVISMTAPVLMDSADKESRSMSFIMPSKYRTTADLPKPLDPRVVLEDVGETTMAAVTFSGMMNEDKCKQLESKLREDCKKDGIVLDVGDKSHIRSELEPIFK